MKYRFPRKLRLTADTQFKQVFRRAKKKTTSLCALFYCYNNLSYPRIGIIVPKKNIKKANKRNVFKRVVREWFRLKQHKIGAIDIIFLAYKEAGNVTKEKLCKQLEKQWEELILQQKKP